MKPGEEKKKPVLAISFGKPEEDDTAADGKKRPNAALEDIAGEVLAARSPKALATALRAFIRQVMDS